MHKHFLFSAFLIKVGPHPPLNFLPTPLITSIKYIISGRQHFTITFPSLWKIRQNIYTVFGVHDEQSDTIYHTNLDVEIHNWRMELRESEFLTTPSRERHPCGISGNPLDEDLVNFSSKCKSNFIDFIKCCANTKTVSQQKCLIPIFITPDERQSFNNAIKSKLHALKEIDCDIGNIKINFIWILCIY